MLSKMENSVTKNLLQLQRFSTTRGAYRMRKARVYLEEERDGDGQLQEVTVRTHLL